jgi:hypothetical protein
VKREENKILTDQIGVLEFLTPDLESDLFGLNLVPTEDKIFAILLHRNGKKVNPSLNLCGF